MVKSESIIRSYPCHILSSICGFQAVIPSSNVDARIFRPLKELQCHNLNSTKVVYFAFCVFLKQRNFKHIWDVCFRLKETKNVLKTFNFYNLAEENCQLVLLAQTTGGISRLYKYNSNCTFDKDKSLVKRCGSNKDRFYAFLGRFS